MSLNGITNKKVKPVCNHCGSSDIRVEAFVEWSVKQQNWTVTSLIDDEVNTSCNRCGRDCIPKWLVA